MREMLNLLLEKEHQRGFFVTKAGIDQAISRGIAYAPYADLVWCETAVPDLEEAKKFAEALKKHYPNQLLAYNCSPSFNWKKNLDDTTIGKFQKELASMGYKYQFITLAWDSQYVVQHVRFDPELPERWNVCLCESCSRKRVPGSV